MSKAVGGLVVEHPKAINTKKTIEAALTLGREAQKVLGYKWLVERAEEVSAEGELLAALLRLEIDVLTPDSVAKYMAQKSGTGEKAAAKLQDEVKKFEARLRRARDSWSAVYISEDTRAKREKEFEARAAKLRVLKWKETSIENYKDGMPDEILEKAIRVKKALPKASFTIVHTVEEKPKVAFDARVWKAKLPQQVEARSIPDPFLKVTLGNTSAYIGVWDETDYPYTALQDSMLVE